MSVMMIFLAVIAAIILWWMAQHRLTSKPWLEVGPAPEAFRERQLSIEPARIGLGVFLAVVGSLFSLFISAYLMRVETPDLWSTPIPRLLWVNTTVLIVSSAAMQWAKTEAQRGRSEAVRTALLAALATAILFLTGQILAWRQLTQAGYVLAGNPANSFFYVITGMHGLHIVGGIVALGRTMTKAWSVPVSNRVRLRVDLCALYWHFMLFVWVVLFALFAGWANDFVDICRQLIS
ncbi:cytochrome c oxidase subunit 3 [Ensifer sp. P24N7]|uniref:cytochrome c oxidase subunit 3 n=1 Tax=Sinorhizobium sp. P24N7 TaxID=3348358 RepID=UPI0035F294C1